jgi:hypothetical protein
MQEVEGLNADDVAKQGDIATRVRDLVVYSSSSTCAYCNCNPEAVYSYKVYIRFIFDFLYSSLIF